MRLRRLIMPLIAAAFLVVIVGGTAAASVPGTALPLAGYGRMQVDAAHGHVFITGGPSDSTILVRNSDGSAVGSITGESGAGGMALDGSTLYVARCGAGVIDEIDTATLTNVGSMAAANIGGTCDLAEAGGALWYTNSSNHLVSLTLDAGHTTTVTSFLIDGPLATTPAHPDWLVAVFSEAYVYVLDVSDPTAPTQLAVAFDPSNAGSITDTAITPDGAELLIASGYPYHIVVLNLPDLSDDGSYPTNNNYPNAVAVTPSGALTAAGADAVSDKDVYLYDSGSQTAKSTWDFGGTSDTLYPRGLAFSADGTLLYAVSKGATGSGILLHVLPTAAQTTGSLSVKASASTVLAGHAVTITAHLGTASANRSVSIYKTPVGGSATLVTTGTVNSNGNLAVTVHPTVTTAYTALWSGDASHTQTTSSATTVKVRLIAHAAAKGSYRTVNGVHLYHYARSCTGSSHTGCPRFLTSSTPLIPGHQINLVVQAKTASGSWRTVLTGSHSTGSDGKLLVIIYYTNRAVIGISQRIRFTYPNDSGHLGHTSAWVQYRVTT
jgi:hypothetical protein